MLKNGINCKRVLSALALLTVLSFCPGGLAHAQEQGAQQKSTKPNETAKKERPDEKDKKDEDRVKQAQTIIEGIPFGTNTILNPIVRIKIRMLAADAYWDFQPEKAREILSEEVPKIALIAAPQNETDFGTHWSIKESEKLYKGRPLEQVKAQLRREIMAIISARDSALARRLVAAEKAKETKSDPHTNEMDEVLSTAQSLADTDPEAAARIIKESLKVGVSDGLVFLLMKLRETSPAEASAIFNQLFSAARTTGDLLQFQQLVPYVLPTELDRLVGGRHYLTDPQRMKDAYTLMEYAADLLYRRILTEAPNNMNMSPEFARREYYIWRNLLTVMNDVKPESVWLINSRLRQLAPVLPQSAQGPPQSPWSEEKINELIDKAKLSFGDKRDEYFSAAAANAWRFGQGDLDRAVSIAENIENPESRDSTKGTLYFQAGLKNLRTEGPDNALGLAKKINLPVFRTRLYLAIIGTFSSVKASERTEALREELLNWLRNSDRTSDTAWAILEYLEGSKNDNSERNFAAFEILVRVLNSPTLDPVNKMKNRIYWSPEFHDFRKSLAPLAKADFDRGMEIIQMVKSREIGMQIQAAFCGDYLRMQSNSRKTSAKPIPKSE